MLLMVGTDGGAADLAESAKQEYWYCGIIVSALQISFEKEC